MSTENNLTKPIIIAAISVSALVAVNLIAEYFDDLRISQAYIMWQVLGVIMGIALSCFAMAVCRSRTERTVVVSMIYPLAVLIGILGLPKCGVYGMYFQGVYHTYIQFSVVENFSPYVTILIFIGIMEWCRRADRHWKKIMVYVAGFLPVALLLLIEKTPAAPCICLFAAFFAGLVVMASNSKSIESELIAITTLFTAYLVVFLCITVIFLSVTGSMDWSHEYPWWFMLLMAFASSGLIYALVKMSKDIRDRYDRRYCIIMAIYFLARSFVSFFGWLYGNDVCFPFGGGILTTISDAVVVTTVVMYACKTRKKCSRKLAINNPSY